MPRATNEKLIAMEGDVAAVRRVLPEKQEICRAAEILPGRFSRSPTAPEPLTLSPAREKLRLCITRLATLQNECEASAEPVRRLESIEVEAQRLRVEPDLSRVSHRRSCPGLRPA